MLTGKRTPYTDAVFMSRYFHVFQKSEVLHPTDLQGKIAMLSFFLYSTFTEQKMPWFDSESRG